MDWSPARWVSATHITPESSLVTRRIMSAMNRLLCALPLALLAFSGDPSRKPRTPLRLALESRSLPGPAGLAAGESSEVTSAEVNSLQSTGALSFQAATANLRLSDYFDCTTTPGKSSLFSTTSTSTFCSRCHSFLLLLLVSCLNSVQALSIKLPSVELNREQRLFSVRNVTEADGTTSGVCRYACGELGSGQCTVQTGLRLPLLRPPRLVECYTAAVYFAGERVNHSCPLCGSAMCSRCSDQASLYNCAWCQMRSDPPHSHPQLLVLPELLVHLVWVRPC